MVARPCRSADAADRAGHGARRAWLFRHRPRRGDDRTRQLHRLARRYCRRARYCARGRQAGRRRLNAVGLCGAASRRRQRLFRSSPRSMRGTSTSICRCSAPGGRTVLAPRLAPLSEAVRAACRAPACIVGSAAQAVADGLAPSASAAARRRCARGARYRLGRAHRRRHAGSDNRRRTRNICARRTRSRKMPPSCRADDALRLPPVRPRRADHRRSAAARCRGHCGAARRFVSARLGRRRILRLLDRTQCGHASRHASAATLIGFILSRAGRGRSGNPVGRDRAGVARPRLVAAAARSASAPPGRTWRPHGVPRSRRTQCAGRAALPPRRLSRSRPPARLL